MTIRVAGNALAQAYVPLAQSGQTPAQEPVAPQSTANVGSQAVSARGDHVHPLGVLGRAPIFGGFPPAMSFHTDLVFDGVWNGQISGITEYGFFGFLTNPIFATLAGSTYSVKNIGANAFLTGPGNPPTFLTKVISRNITVNSGVTLQNAPGMSILLMASQTINISGTVSASGASAVGANGGTGSPGSSVNQAFQGLAGATGTTASGTVGKNFYGTALCLGGAGGAGGQSGGAIAGGAAAPNVMGYFGTGIDALINLYGTGTSGAGNGPAGWNYAQGGSGGSSGGGDGSFAGGGGGGGGAFIILVAPQINIAATAVLNVAGGNAASGVGGNAGGGGGGGGGMINIHGLGVTIANGATLSTGGGTAGALSGTGSAGSNGSAMTTALLDPSIPHGGYGYGAGCLICQWQ